MTNRLQRVRGWNGWLRAAVMLVLLLGAARVQAQVNLGIDIQQPVAAAAPAYPANAYIPGTSASYTMTVSNTGTATENDGAITTSFPAGLVSSWSCSASGTGTSCGLPTSSTLSDNLTNRTVDTIATGGVLTFTFNVDFGAALTSNVVVPVQVVSSATTPVTSNDTVTSTPQRVSNASVVKSPLQTQYTPGASGTYTIVVANAGPSNATGLTLTDTPPTGMSLASWSCSSSPAGNCSAPSGSGAPPATLNLQSGANLTYTVTANYAASAAADPIINTASIAVAAPATDPSTANNSDNASKARLVQSDLAVAFTPAPPPALTYTPGTTGAATTLTVSNGGPSNSTGASVLVDLPPEVASVAWSCLPLAACSPASGTGNGTGDIATSVTLAANASVALQITPTYGSAALDEAIDFVATATAPGGSDPESDNDSATRTYAIDRRADISVAKTSVLTSVNPGTAFEYRVQVRNLGPSDVGQGPNPIGIRLTDSFVPQLLGNVGECTDPARPCWKYCPSDGGVVGDYTISNCPVELAADAGNIAGRSFQLRAGSSSTVVAYVSLSGTASGSIVNTATVTLDGSGVAEINPGTGNSSTVTLPVVVNTDISVDKTDGVTSAIPGTTHSYKVTVRNIGFITANNVLVEDALPLFAADGDAGFVPDSIAYQCRAFGGACCNTNSAICGTNSPTVPITTDSMAQAVDLPSQSRVEFTITGMLDPRASGTLQNQARATLPPGITESNTANNVDADNDTQLTPQAQLTLEKSLVSLTPTDDGPPFALRYRIDVANAGPSRALSANITDALESGNLDAGSAQWTCSTQAGDPCGSGSGALDLDVDLDVGSSVSVELDVDTVTLPIGPVLNTARVSSAAGSAIDSLSTSLSGSADLSISKTDNLSQAIPGTQTEYVIEVANVAGDDVFGARVLDAFPPELENVSWTCAATTPVPGDLDARDLVGASATAGNALVTSADGRHVYQLGSAINSLFVYRRVNEPGLSFGQVASIETEVNAVNDAQDPGPAVSGMEHPIDIALSRDGAMVFVLSHAQTPGQSSSLVAFNRVVNPNDPSFGRLSFAASLSQGIPTLPRRLVVSGSSVYVSGDGVIAVYRRDPVSGLPAYVEPQSTGVPAAPGPLALSAGDSLLLVASSSGNQLASFAINPTVGASLGRLTPISTLSNANFAGGSDLVIDPPARRLHLSAGGTVNTIQYTAAGTMSVFASYTSADLELPAGLGDPLLGSTRLALAPDGEHLILASRAQGALVQFRRDTQSGGLAFEAVLAADHPIIGANIGLSLADDVAISADGRHLLIASADGSGTRRPLAVYARRAPDPLFAFLEVDRDGDDAEPDPISGLQAPTDVAVSRDGHHVYAVSIAEGAISVFKRDNTLGLNDDTAGQHLQFVHALVQGQGGVTGLASANRVLVSPDGLSVYVSSEVGNSVALFDRDADQNSATFGQLTFIGALGNGGGVTGLLGAHGMAMDSGSEHLYVAGSFEAAIAIFRRNADHSLSQIGVVRSGTGGVTGLGGIRDLVVTGDDAQLLGVGSTSNTVVAFNRNDGVGAEAGLLSFVQSRSLGNNERPVSISVPGGSNPMDNEHVYVAALNGSKLFVLRRVTDPSSPAFGTLESLFSYANNAAGITRMNGPRDVDVSADGKRLYVAAQFDHSVLIFDRDLNRSSANFGGLRLVDARSSDVDGVAGLDSVYALAVSADSRNVYAAGFGDEALASFAVGTGSSCSAGGGGDIDDLVTLGAGGTLVYRASATIRADATGTLLNSARVELPLRFTDPVPGNNDSTDSTSLDAQADLSVSKTNSQVSVVAGQAVTYEVVVRNPGPSNVVHGPGHPVTVSDRFDLNPGFAPDSVQWTCAASGSGALDFIDATFDTQPADGGDPDPVALRGVSGLAVLPHPPGSPLPARYLAATSVLDSSLTLFERDAADGRLLQRQVIRQGAMLNLPVTALDGARSVVASGDGQFLYVASRVSDAISVFRLVNAAGTLRVDLVEEVRNRIGLDQALHLALSPDGAFLYVAGANDNAIAAFARDASTGHLSYLESEQNGVDNPNDPGGLVAGLQNVEFLVVSPDGAHLYALSGTGGSVARFDRAADGTLTWRSVRTGNDFGLSIAGASSAAFDPSGDYLYVTAAGANRVAVLRRNAVVGPDFGSLTLASSVTQGSAGTLGLLSPRRVLLSADAAHLYVTSQSGGAVAWFVRDPADGSLRFLGLRSNESSGVDGLAGATGMALDPELDQLYVAGTLQNAVVHFDRQSDSFCPPSGSGNASLDAVPVSIAAGGSVTFSISAIVSSNLTGPLENIATVQAAADPETGNNSATDTDVQSVVADLSISKSDGLAEYDGLDGAAAITGNARHLYVAGSTDNAIGVFRRVDDPGQSDFGKLGFASVVRSGTGGVSGIAAVADVLLSPDGAHVYAVSPTDNSIASFRRDASSGALGFLEFDQNGVLGVAGIAGARALAQSADGRHVYVAGSFSNAIAVFARDADPASPDYGRLTWRSLVQNGVAGVDGIGEPVALAVSPDGLHVYALGAVQDTIAVFARNPSTGSSGFGNLVYSTRYTEGVGGFTGMAGARSLVVDAAGEFVYVLGADDGTIAQLARNPGSGALAFVEFKQDGTGGVSGLAGARRLRLSADQAHLYVAGSGVDAIAHFSVDAGDGTLDFAALVANGDPAALTGGQVIGLGGASDVLPSSDGAQLYAVAADDDAVTSFERDPASGVAGGTLDFRDALFDGLGGVAPGQQVTYLIRVDNAGPSDVPQARVIDAFPPEFDAVSWTCTPSNNANCAAGGNGNINTLVNLPVGGRVVFAATGVVGDSAGGRLINTATVAAQGAVDPDESNNSATDGDTVLSPAMDLVVSVDDGATAAVPGGRVDYSVEISNLGPTYATGAIVSDRMPAALLDVEWSCAALPVNGVLASTQQLVTPLDRYRALSVSALGRFAYAVGDIDSPTPGNGAIAVYQRNPLSGELTVLDVIENGVGGVAGLVGANDLLLSNDERFLYVASTGSDAVTVFARDAENGALSFLAQYQDGELGIEGLGGASSLLLSPSGAQLYVGSAQDDAIAIFSVNPASGLLTQSGLVTQVQAGVDGLNGVADMAFSADAAHLLVVGRDNDSLAAFSRHPTSGALSFAAIVQDFQLPDHPLLAPSALQVVGDQVLVAASGSNAVLRFGFAPTATPAFTLDLKIADGVDGVTGFSAPRDLLFASEQSRLYVAAGDAIHLFSLESDPPEMLGAIHASSYPALSGLVDLQLSPDRRQLLSAAAGAGGGIGVWARERGSRCPIAGTRQLDSHTVEIAPGGSVTYSVGGEIFANASGTLVYEVEVQPALVDQELNPPDNIGRDSNLLTPAADLSVTKSDGLGQIVAGRPLSYAIDVANAGVSDALAAQLRDLAPIFPASNPGLLAGSGSWSCSANAPLAFRGSVEAITLAALQGVTVMATSPDATRLYAVNPAQSALLVFPLDGDGVPGTPLTILDGQSLGGGTVQGLGGASSVTVTADGRHVLVTGASANSLVVFGYDGGTGTHRFIQKLTSGSDDVVGLIGPVDVVATRDGERVFAAAPGSESIAVFTRNADSGELTFVERVRDGLGTIVPDSNVIRGVRRLHASEDGANLYAVATLSQAVSSFSINPVSGQLAYLGALRSPAIAGLAGARDLVASPGDEQLYALGSSAITTLARQADGRLQLVGSSSAIPGLGQTAALSLDASGSRLYLADSVGAVHVFARDWSNGALDHRLRFTHASAALATPGELLHLPSSALLFASSPTPGGIAWLDEQALSRCLTSAAHSDAVTLDLDLGASGWGHVDFAATVHPSARGVLQNTATLLPADGSDPLPGDNSATDGTTILAVSDLMIAKTAPAQVVAGTNISFQIRVGNSGPSDSLGLRVVDTLHPALRDVTWTCIASEESTCAASGSGSVDVASNLLVGDELTILVVARVDPAFLGTLPNLATVVPEPGATDPTPGDQQSSTSTEVTAVADVSVSKTNGVSEQVAGEFTTYRIVAQNAGPSDAPDVSLRDLLPVVFNTVSWSCVASGNAVCPNGGSGAPDLSVALPAGASVQLDLTALLSPAARGEVENRVSVAVNGAPTDPDVGNNAASDRDDIVSRIDLSLDLIDAFDPFDPAASIDLVHVARVRNVGPSQATEVSLEVSFAPTVDLVLPPSCVANGPGALICGLGSMNPGVERDLSFTLRNLPAAPSTLTASGTVVALEDEAQLADNAASETTELRTGGDVVVSIANAGNGVLAGETTVYRIQVRNIGSQTVDPVTLDVPIAPELLNATWTCSGTGGATCAASGTGSIVDTLRLQRGQVANYVLTATVDATLDSTQPQSVNQSVVATVPTGSDLNLLNNAATDADVVIFQIFTDGFEAPPPTRAKHDEVAVAASAACAPLPLQGNALARDGHALTLLRVLADDGTQLLQLDALHHADRGWLQLGRDGLQGTVSSGWRPWTERSMPFDPLRADRSLAALAPLPPDRNGTSRVAQRWMVPRDAMSVAAWTALSEAGCLLAAAGGSE